MKEVGIPYPDMWELFITETIAETKKNKKVTDRLLFCFFYYIFAAIDTLTH